MRAAWKKVGSLFSCPLVTAWRELGPLLAQQESMIPSSDHHSSPIYLPLFHGEVNEGEETAKGFLGIFCCVLTRGDRMIDDV